MFCPLVYWSFTIFVMMSCSLSRDILLPHITFCWFTIAHSFSRCFTIAHVCYPTLIFNIIVRCDVLSSGLLMFHHLFHVILQSYSRCFTIAYSFVDASPSYILLADVSPSHVFVILLWSSISLLGVMFYPLVYWCFAIFAMLSCHLLADVSPSHILLPMLRHRTFF